MNLLINLWTNWTVYEKVREGVFLLLIFALTILAIYYATKEMKIVILSALSLIFAALINVLGILLVNIFLEINITEIFRLIPVITSILLISNLGLLAGYYISKRHRKNFTFDLLRAEYQADTVKQTIFLVLLALSMFLFVSTQTQAILSISVLSTLISVWGTYWISKYFLK